MLVRNIFLCVISIVRRSNRQRDSYHTRLHRLVQACWVTAERDLRDSSPVIIVTNPRAANHFRATSAGRHSEKLPCISMRWHALLQEAFHGSCRQTGNSSNRS
jgi:hypothetical protein